MEVRQRKIGSESQEKDTSKESILLKRILHWDEIEEWQRDNEFIHNGYVRSEKSFKAVLKSLGFFHNESGNIYTHLIPALFILVVYTYAQLIWPWQFVLFGSGCVACLGMSATFHTLKSHSHSVAILGNKLDYLGICVLIATSMFAILGYAMDDSPTMFTVFSTITAVLGSACAVVSLMNKFRSREWRPYRATIFVLYGLSGALPIVFGLYYWGLEETKRRCALKWLLWEAFFYIFGAFLYAARFPEKYFPGSFDYIGHAHQIFHVMVVIAAWCHLRALYDAQAYHFYYMTMLNAGSSWM